MSLVLYDTKTRAKRDFVPIDPKRVGMYVCGPTVYDRAHIGNARPVIVFDVLYRLLRRIYGAEHVTYVRNITDIDDKINAAAAANNEPIAALTKRTTAVFHADMAALGALPPDEEPRATDHVAGMIEMTATLIARGHAYEAEGHVLFDVPSMAGYGALSGRSLKEMIAGARVDVAPYKKNPGDFILWKPSSGDLPGWDSPWGRGRPGWHLECSVMSEKFLGLPVDIHGGGQDLIFPHHENERAQSLCAHGIETFANYWMHNGFVNMGEKMSKSLGNIITVGDVLEEIGHKRGEIVRFLMLGTHYRKPLDWTSAGLGEARSNIVRLYRALDALGDVEADGDAPSDEVMAALCDDLNTPKAIAELYSLATNANKETDAAVKARLKGALLAGGEILGLLQHKPEFWFKDIPIGLATEKDTAFPITDVKSYSGLTKEEIDELIANRMAARKAKNFSVSDSIREKLAADWIIVEDTKGGPKWYRFTSMIYLSSTLRENIKKYCVEQWAISDEISVQKLFKNKQEIGFSIQDGVLLPFNKEIKLLLSVITTDVVKQVGVRRIDRKEVENILLRSVSKDFTWENPNKALRLFEVLLSQQVSIQWYISLPNYAMRFNDGLKKFDIGPVTLSFADQIQLQLDEHNKKSQFKAVLSAERTINDDVLGLGFGKYVTTVKVRVSSGKAEDEAKLLARVALGLLRLASTEIGAKGYVPRFGEVEPEIFEKESGDVAWVAFSQDEKLMVSGWNVRPFYEMGEDCLEHWLKSGWQAVADKIFQEDARTISLTLFDAMDRWAVARRIEHKVSRASALWALLAALTIGLTGSNKVGNVELVLRRLLWETEEPEPEFFEIIKQYEELSPSFSTSWERTVNEKLLLTLEHIVETVIWLLCSDDILSTTIEKIQKTFSGGSKDKLPKLRSLS